MPLQVIKACLLCHRETVEGHKSLQGRPKSICKPAFSSKHAALWHISGDDQILPCSALLQYLVGIYILLC